MARQLTQAEYLETFLRENPRTSVRSGALSVNHSGRRYLAERCAGCCGDCPGWHLVHDDEGARAHHRRLFNPEGLP